MESITDTWRFPDLNPIENLWHKLKGILWQLIKPSNKEEQVSGIKQFWDSVIPQKCQKYIQHESSSSSDQVPRKGIRFLT